MDDFSWVDDTETFKSLVLSLVLPMRRGLEIEGSIPMWSCSKVLIKLISSFFQAMPSGLVDLATLWKIRFNLHFSLSLCSSTTPMVIDR